MTEAEAPIPELPPDPTFPPAAYDRVSRLLRNGILIFLVFAGVGMTAQLVLNPSQTVASVLASDPRSTYGSVGGFFHALGTGEPGALIIFGIYVMVAVTIGRVVLATAELFRGGERALGAISASVVVLLLIGLFVVAPFVR
jgi:uncharacterized membrane protein